MDRFVLVWTMFVSLTFLTAASIITEKYGWTMIGFVCIYLIYKINQRL